MIRADKFTPFVDGEEIDAEKAFLTTCDICGEWLDYTAKVEYDPNEDKQIITIESTSCGEKFRLIPLTFRMEKIYE